MVLLRRIFVTGGLGVLAGCANIPPDRETTMIVGIRIPQRPRSLESSYLRFDEYDPISEELLPNGNRILITSSCWSDCGSSEKIEYETNAIRSGYYVLRNIGYTIRRGSAQTIGTDFFGIEYGGLFGSSKVPSRNGSIKGTKLLRYLFLPGESVYIGNISVDYIQVPAKILKIDYDDKSALDVLIARDFPSGRFYSHPTNTQTPVRP